MSALPSQSNRETIMPGPPAWAAAQFVAASLCQLRVRLLARLRRSGSVATTISVSGWFVDYAFMSAGAWVVSKPTVTVRVQLECNAARVVNMVAHFEAQPNLGY